MVMTMIKRILFLLLSSILLFSCFKKSGIADSESSILVTIPPYAFFAEKITGNTVSVKTLVPPGMNLHIFEPTPKQIENIINATVWFQIDEPFEKKITKSFKEKNPKLMIVNLQSGIPLISSDNALELNPCDRNDDHHHHHGMEDLHTWLSPKLALKQAKMIAEALITLFPEHAMLYQKNYNNLALELKKLDQEIAQKLLPFKGESILLSHPALGYYCQDYGLIQLSVECEGKDPRPKTIEKIMQRIEDYPVRCVLLQQGFNNKGAQLIGKKLQLPIYRIDPYAKEYIKNMRRITQYIVQ